MPEKTREKEAFNQIAITFVRLIQRDKDIPHKREVIAYWEDFFAHPGVKANMVQAISNFLWDQDDKVDAKLKDEMKALLDIIPKVADADNENTQKIMAAITAMINVETIIEDVKVEDVDLSEVGGGDEDDTSPL